MIIGECTTSYIGDHHPFRPSHQRERDGAEGFDRGMGMGMRKNIWTWEYKYNTTCFFEAILQKMGFLCGMQNLRRKTGWFRTLWGDS